VFRVVIGTNAMVSALIGPGEPRRLVARDLEYHPVMTSTEMVEESAIDDMVHAGPRCLGQAADILFLRYF
jgi:predicted nucleic acid-binding protein